MTADAKLELILSNITEYVIAIITFIYANVRILDEDHFRLAGKYGSKPRRADAPPRR